MKKAFTLAEVLITLGIIGVVAAITLPSLIQNYKKQVYVAGAKKAVSVISNLLEKEMAAEGVSSITDTRLYSETSCIVDDNGYCEDGYNTTAVFEEIVPKYLNVIKTCHEDSCNDIKYGIVIENNCSDDKCNFKFTDSTDKIRGEMGGHVDNFNEPYIFYTADGMIYYFRGGEAGIAVDIDTNGKHGPNVEGYDLFCITIYGNKLVGTNFYRIDYGKNTISGYLMSNGWKMDY